MQAYKITQVSMWHTSIHSSSGCATFKRDTKEKDDEIIKLFRRQL